MRRVVAALFLAQALAAAACSGGENAAPSAADRSKIAFVRSHDVDHDVYSMNADGSGQTKLAEGEGSLIWLAGGSKIAFTRVLEDGEVQTVVMNADGSGQARVGKNVGNAGVAFSPDGSKIVFARWGRGGVWYRQVFEIYVANANGSVETRLYRTRGSADAPTSAAWSPDSSKIAFISPRDRSWAGMLEDIRAGYAVTEIYVANADASSVTRLTKNRNADYQPVWSPNASKIAFISERGTRGEPPLENVVSDVYVMNSDGSGQTRLTDIGTVDGGRGHGPSWSPDGSKIAFLSYGASGIYVMNADGSAVRRVTKHDADSLSWSPDSSKIAFGDNGIFVVNADGSGLTRLTQTSDSTPAWSPEMVR